jgi:CDP-diacylglycerol---glycerol-3-phosphate 3-phosphatidyltransferase
MRVAKKLNFPIILTLIRLIVSPLVLPVALAYFLSQHNLFINSLLALFFLLLSATDFLDGYIARNYGQVTDLGKILDPIADKFLIYSTLVTLVALGKFYFYWAIIIVGREFFVMGLREVAAHYHFSIPVSVYGKAKTIAQISLLTVVIINPTSGTDLNPINILEKSLLAISLILTIFSAILYFNHFQTEFKKQILTH